MREQRRSRDGEQKNLLGAHGVNYCEEYNTYMLLARIASLVLCLTLVAGCRKAADTSLIGTFRMGEKVQAGPLEYQVVETDWRGELGNGGRTPKDRYLFVKVSVTNLSASGVSAPGFSLQGPGTTHAEINEDMDKVDNWLGLLRNLNPKQTEQGWIVFDVPMAAYKLVIPDGGEVGSEKFAHVDIPVHLE